MHSRGNNSTNKKKGKPHQIEFLSARFGSHMAGGASGAAIWSSSSFGVQGIEAA